MVQGTQTDECFVALVNNEFDFHCILNELRGDLASMKNFAGVALATVRARHTQGASVNVTWARACAWASC